MENLGSVLEFLDNKSILVIGATGFLAKILVEKILRTQPNVKKLYLLIRAADKQSANLRLQNEIIEKDLFKVLKAKVGENHFSNFIQEKVTMVPGDIILGDDLGIQDDTLKQEIWHDLDIIFNMAATTRFYERYDVSLNINTFGAKHVMNFGKKCINLKVFVHVSTAYVCGTRTGLILENSYNMGDTMNEEAGLDIDEEMRLVFEKLKQLQAENATNEIVKIAMKDMGVQRAKTYGWPNVYVFTKALGEMVIMEQNKELNLPLVISRPTIITSTFKEPFPGWIEGTRTVDSFIVGYGEGKLTSFAGNLQSVSDMIPADIVVNATIVMALAHQNKPASTYPTLIYHIGSSKQNPVKHSLIKDVVIHYFSKHPWIDRNGKQVVVGSIKVHSSPSSFRRNINIKYLLPLKGIKILSKVFHPCLKTKCAELDKKIKFLRRMSDIYEPYLFFDGIFDNSNTEKLLVEAKKNGVETYTFYFDPKDINWEDYFMRIHIPGVVKYLFN